MLPQDRERIVVEVVQRVLARHSGDPVSVERTLFDTIYAERQRLELEKDRAAAARDGAFYDVVYHEARRAAPARQRELLRDAIERFAREVVGRFDPRVYAVATRAIPPALTVLLNTLSPLRLLQALPSGLATLEERVEVGGEVEALKAAARLGTTVLVPTHSSNLDSIVIGFVLYQLGLPPYIYGAGINLFANRLIGFFMHNLGAYKVDRRKKATLYKEVLKTYAGCSMEMGYHNLFFPGGTRSRSGAVENKLKLGLLGMALDAYIHNLRGNKPRPDLFVVPCTIDYQLVLEAETLIGDYLKDVGKSRYVIDDDEFSQPRRVLDFARKLFSLNSHIQVVVSKPLDVFGNQIDDEGRSHDRRGRPVDRSRYVTRNGEPTFDRQRDEEYTRELASTIVGAYRRDTTLSSTHLLAHAAFNVLRERNPELDLYRLLRTGGREEGIPLTDVYDRLDRELAALRRAAAEQRVRLDDTLRRRDSVAIVNEALAHLASYHRTPALARHGDRLFHEDRTLLLYYQGRLASLGVLQEPGVKRRDHTEPRAP